MREAHKTTPIDAPSLPVLVSQACLRGTIGSRFQLRM